MQNIVNPLQTLLFDPFDGILTEKTRKQLLDDWPGVFRHIILELMPVNIIAGHFDPKLGRPTKELYSMAGLLLIMEFKNWTKDDALEAYRYHMNIHFALNIEPVAHDISMRTLERYINLFEEDNMAKAIMSDITVKLVDLLGLKIDQQRLDSTHIFSDMASFGRSRMMGVTIKRFLTQVKRHNLDQYDALPELLRQRYAPSVHQLFGNTGKDSESRRLLRQQVADDMYVLVRHFAELPECAGMNTYKLMVRVFYDQCDVHEDTVEVKAKTGGNVIQNPSDPDATYDGHKGPGYQAQIAETCNPENDVQLITSVISQTAVESDSNAVLPVLEDLKESDLLPESMLGDTLYAGDENVQLSEEYGVELVGPVPSGPKGTQDANELNVDDFNIDQASEEVICCPAGHSPESSVHDNQTGKTRTIMPESACGQCDYVAQCPVKKNRNGYCLDHTAKDRRIAARRHEEATDVFQQRYRLRGGLEGTNSGLKRRTGLGQLRVRGKPRVSHSIYLKIAGWNILRASVCAKIREIVYERAKAAIFDFQRTILQLKFPREVQQRGPRCILSPPLWQFEKILRFHAAA